MWMEKRDLPLVTECELDDVAAVLEHFRKHTKTVRINYSRRQSCNTKNIDTLAVSSFCDRLGGLRTPAMNREDVTWFVEQHVLGPAVRRVTRSRMETRTTACFKTYFFLASTITETVIQRATIRIHAEGARQMKEPSVDTVQIQVASEVATKLVGAIVAEAIDSTPSHRHAHHRYKDGRHHDQCKQSIHLMAIHAVLTEILPAAVQRVLSSYIHHDWQVGEHNEIPESLSNRGGHFNLQLEPPISKDERSIVSKDLHRAAKKYVASTILTAIASVTPAFIFDTTLPNNANEKVAEANPADDGISQEAHEVLPFSPCTAPNKIVETPTALSPLPAEAHKSSPRRKKHGVKTKERPEKEEVESLGNEESVEPQVPIQAVLPPLKLPASPRASGLRPLNPVQSPPRTARTAAAVIITAPPPDQAARSPVLLPPVVKSPRSTTSHSTLVAIYHPKPPPQSNKSRPELPEQPVEGDGKRPGQRRVKVKEKKPKIPSGFCQRCALDGRACKLRDCLKHQPPLRPPPGNRGHHLIES